MVEISCRARFVGWVARPTRTGLPIGGSGDPPYGPNERELREVKQHDLSVLARDDVELSFVADGGSVAGL